MSELSFYFDVLSLSGEINSLKEGIAMLTARIAELEGKFDQLTAHGDIERQDDKWIPEVRE